MLSHPHEPSSGPRVVSLDPGATEALCALGAGPMLVGRSHVCDYPPQTRSLPVVTGSNIPPGEPGTIDGFVQNASALGQPLANVFADRLRALRPDVVVTGDLGPLGQAAVEAALGGLTTRPRTLHLAPTTVEGVLDTFLELGRAVGRESKGVELVVRLRERFYTAHEFVNPYDDGPVAVFLSWTQPLICAGGWTAQLVERAGARHPLNPTVPQSSAGAAAGPQFAQRIAGPPARVTVLLLTETDPERLVICPCGMDLAQTRACVRGLADEPWWSSLRAVREGNVALVDGTQMFHRPSPRLIDAFEWLVAWLNGVPGMMPQAFPWAELTSPSP